MGGDDTIFAVATGAGRAAIAILRLSGSGTRALVGGLCGGRVPLPRQARLRTLRDGAGAVLDRAMVLWLPGPGSYTGEDSAELHVHGGVATLEAVGAALVAAGSRPADAGEFTRRAFTNGRMDLTAAEAVADLIEAETAAQRDQALRQLHGKLGEEFDAIGAELRLLLAEQEARIDFPEETGDGAPLEAGIRRLAARLEEHLRQGGRGERLRNGLVIAVVGAPNAGKSSLVNALAGRSAAIVAPTPGTTRDVLEVRCVFGGVPCVLLDTAGLRESDDPVEIEGVRRARARAATADLVVHVQAADGEAAEPGGSGVIAVASKIDLAPAPPGRVGVSAMTGESLDRLRAVLDERARQLTRGAGPPPLTRERHRFATEAAISHLQAALGQSADEVRAEELRLAMQCVGRITGRVGVEDVLETVFSRFCIGK